MLLIFVKSNFEPNNQFKFQFWSDLKGHRTFLYSAYALVTAGSMIAECSKYSLKSIGTKIND